MAKKQVVTSTCDRCGFEADTEYKPKQSNWDRFVLPDGWLHVEGNTNKTTVFEMDLCSVCKKAVLAAAGRGDVT
jgi:hypothetical protein